MTTTTALTRAARTVAEVRGWTGRPGGWIYDNNGRPICHGWASLAQALVRAGYIDADGRPAWRRMDLTRNPANRVRAHV